MASELLVRVLSKIIEVIARKGVELALEKLITREKEKQFQFENAKAKGVVLGRKTNLTNEIRSRILELKAEGATIRKIASECAVGTQTVYKVLRAGNSVLGVPGAI